MLTIAGLILFTLLWALALSGLLECLAPLKKQMKKSFFSTKKLRSPRVWKRDPQF